MVIEAPFSLTEYRFQEIFLENKLLFNFYWFSAEHFKIVGEKLPQNLSKPQSTRLMKNFRWKKIILIVTTWFFTSFLVFWVKLCWIFGGKNSAGLGKLHSKQPEIFFEQKRFFFEKIKIFKFFRKFFGSWAKSF